MAMEIIFAAARFIKLFTIACGGMECAPYG